MDAAETQPVCIIGMQRSGTSMVARLLNLYGLDLGGPDALKNRDKYNPGGYFENLAFRKINNNILSHLGKSWHDPPAVGAGWEAAPALAPLAEEAQRAIGAFVGKRHWGWKDPSTTLVLPFWKRLIPNMRFIICLRDPLEVTHSLATKYKFPMQRNAYLWYHYTYAALRYTEGCVRTFAFYEDFFLDGKREARRLAHFCRLENGGDLANLVETVLLDLRHHRSDAGRLLGHPDIAAEYKLLYLGLRALAVEARFDAGGGDERDAVVSDRVATLMGLFDALRDERDIARLESELAEKEQRLQVLQSKLQVLLNEADIFTRWRLRFNLFTAFARLRGRGRSSVDAGKRS